MNSKIPFCLLFLWLGSALSGFAAGNEESIFQAMNDELERSLQRLSLADLPPPYFLSYRIRDYESFNLRTRFGGELASERANERFLYIDLRAGNDSLDNTNFYGKWQDLWNLRSDLVEDDQYGVLRHQIWFYTDKTYKAAAENLARKNAYLQAHPAKESIPDFSPADSYVFQGDSASLQINQVAWEKKLADVAAPFAIHARLADWRVDLSVQAINQWYVNSQGSKHRKGELYYILEISASAQAQDGQRLTGFLQYCARNENDLPAEKTIQADVRNLAENLEEMICAPAVDEYVGPVLFTDRAAAQFVSQMFVDNLALPRAALTTEDWMSQYLSVGKLAGKLKRRIFPPFVTISDEPQMRDWQEQPLIGFQTVDDEGMKCQNITLVKEGRLLTLPMNRQPNKKIPLSNGHARSSQFQRTVPGIYNLIVSSSAAEPLDKMITDLRRMCREQEIEYGLLIKSLEEPRFSQQYQWTESADEQTQKLLTAPVIVYKVYEKDGRMEPMRGLEFDEVSMMTLRNIAVLGKDSQVYNLTQPSVLSGSYYPAAIVTPSILVEEMELKGTSSFEPLPITKNPIFGQ